MLKERAIARVVSHPSTVGTTHASPACRKPMETNNKHSYVPNKNCEAVYTMLNPENAVFWGSNAPWRV